VGLCAVIFQFLPPQPRATIHIEPFNSILAVSPGGRAVTIFGQTDIVGGRVPVRIWDTTDGSLRTIVTEMMAGCVQSADGQWLVFGVGPEDRQGGTRRVQIINLATGDQDVWTGPPDVTSRFEKATFSPDNRWLVFAEWHEDFMDPDGLRLWNLETRSPGALIENARDPLFSPDGQLMSVSVPGNNANEIDATDGVIRETAGGREVGRIPIRRGHAKFLTPDGRGLVVGTCTSGDSLQLLADQYRCIDITNGRDRWTIEDVKLLLPILNGRQLVINRGEAAIPYDEFVTIDVNDGKTARIPMSDDEGLWAAGPMGKTRVFNSQRLTTTDTVRMWLANHGLKWFRLNAWAHDVRDIASGHTVLRFPNAAEAMYASDESSIATLCDRGTLALWDLPPRKPLGWFALAAGILALPIAWLARRRVRRLRSLAGVSS
jgi:WD40 repeat protein